jgi:uncharacterized OsmC-like protein/alpha/beta superfamily hydrolase
MTSRRRKLTFTNRDDLELSGLLELPAGEPRAYALFAHCFTCGKDIAAATRISRALAGADIAVLRFDFTGLGNSDGDFANTSFSSNVEDLVSAANFLRENFQAPQLLIGHSLGGAAVLSAAGRVPEARGVVTLAAPSTPEHVGKQFQCDMDRLREDGEADVELGGRRFRLKRSFLEDIEQYRLDEDVRSLDKALLIFHSPVDQVVSVNEAAHIYQMARHPKSFISLDDADHLLSRRADASYVAQTISAWAERYLPEARAEEETRRARNGEVEVLERNHGFLRYVVTDQHIFQSDEPESVGGYDYGPDPYELLLASLGSCTSMTVRMYAQHKEWPLDDVRVRLNHDREHRADCEDCDSEGSKVDVLYRYIHLDGDLDADQRQRLLQIADRCPVHKTLLNLESIQTQEE